MPSPPSPTPMTSTNAASLLNGATCAIRCAGSISGNERRCPRATAFASPRKPCPIWKPHASIAQDSPQSAAAMIGRILDAIDLLEVFSNRTVVERRSSSLRHPVRSLPVKPYVIYFRVIEEEHIVVIRHIRHGARRPPESLG